MHACMHACDVRDEDARGEGDEDRPNLPWRRYCDRHDPTRHAPPRYRLEPPAGTHDGPAGSPATVDFRAAAGEWARKHQKYLFSGNGTGNNCLFDCVGMAFNGSRKSSFNERVRELCQLVINTIAEVPAHLGEACHLSTGISISGAS